MAADSDEGGRYFAADYELAQERERLRLLESIGDPRTIRTFGTIGVGPGWRCFEAGAGEGSIARWLGARVGPTGHVVAADLDPRFLDDLPALGIEVRRCDVTCDEIESAAYDLVHCRVLMVHMRDPLEVLRRMAAALRPGGWLVVEEPDYGTAQSLTPDHPATAGFHAYLRARHEFLIGANVMDLHYGARLPADIDRLGLEATDSDVGSTVERGGSVKSGFLVQSFAQLDDMMLAGAAISESELADARRAMEDPAFVYQAPTMYTVWGRKPLSARG
ncbi:methyltransferase domain-containing protein [Mycolicibacterium neworleansense]|uniref:Methyltransferase n=1 Tax=Mycolicibacterium neworleansense TaxID=146018 RepID=A0A0H5RZ33_9MYCO|nr:methyltransferase domain-containing protein [Mycolicibacterium neworleansense]MCV7364185.1 methyltransferase domain-containing protein [Mycolicibacterium neworleansense]CRZ19121.1 methyltransferase [Mycolicibacterium neworleansense]